MGNYTHLALQLSTTISSSNNSIDDIFVAQVTMWVCGILFCVTLFVVWVWSMIAMINLNARFRDFLEYYLQHEQGKGIISTVEHERALQLQNYKTEEQKKSEMAEKLAKLKPRKAYAWAALSIPLLVVALVLIVALYH